MQRLIKTVEGEKKPTNQTNKQTIKQRRKKVHLSLHLCLFTFTVIFIKLKW